MSEAVTGVTQADIALYRLRKLIPSFSQGFDDALCEKLKECLWSIDSHSDDKNILHQLDFKSKTMVMTFLSKGLGKNIKVILHLGNIIITNIIQELKQQSFASEFVVPDATLKDWCKLFETWIKGTQNQRQNIDSDMLEFLETFVCLIRLLAQQGHINKKRIELLSDHFIPSIWLLVYGHEGIEQEIVKLIEECIVGDIYLAEVLATTLTTAREKTNAISSKKRKVTEISNETISNADVEDKIDNAENKATTNKNKSSFCENLINKLSDGYWSRESTFVIKASFIGKILLAVSATSQKLMEQHSYDASKSMGKQSQFIDEIVSSRRHILRILHFSLLLMDRISRHCSNLSTNGSMDGLLGVGVLRSHVLSATVSALAGKALPNHTSLEKYHELQAHLYATTLQTIEQLIAKYDHSVNVLQEKDQCTCIMAIAMHMNTLRHLQTIDHHLLLTHVKPLLSILFHASLPAHAVLQTPFQATMMSIWQIYSDLRSQDILIESWLDHPADAFATPVSGTHTTILLFLLEDYPTIEAIIDALRRLPEAKWRALWRKMFYRVLPVQSHAHSKAKREENSATVDENDCDDNDVDVPTKSTNMAMKGVTSVSILHCFVYFIVFRAYQEIPRKHTVIQVGDKQLLQSQGREEASHLPPIRQLLTALHQDLLLSFHDSVTDRQPASGKWSVESLLRHRLRLLGAVIDHLMHEFASSFDLLCKEDLPSLLLVDVTQVLLRRHTSLSGVVFTEYLTTMNLLEAFRCNVIAKVPAVAIALPSQVSHALTPVSVFAFNVITDSTNNNDKNNTMDTVHYLSLSLRAFHGLLQSFFVNDFVQQALATPLTATETKTGVWSLMAQGMTAFYDFAALRRAQHHFGDAGRGIAWTEAEDAFTRLVAVLSSATYLDVQWIANTLLMTHLYVLQLQDTVAVAQRLVTLATLLQGHPVTHYEDATIETRKIVCRLCHLVLRHITSLTTVDNNHNNNKELHKIDVHHRRDAVLSGWSILSHFKISSSDSSLSQDAAVLPPLFSFLEDIYLLVCGVSHKEVSQRDLEAMEEGLAVLCVAAGTMGKTQEALYCLQMCLCGTGHAGLWQGGVVLHSVSRLLQRYYALLLCCSGDSEGTNLAVAEKIATQCLTRLRDAYEVVLLQNTLQRERGCNQEMQREALGAYATLYAEHLFALCRMHSLVTTTLNTASEEKLKRLERYVDFSCRLLQLLVSETYCVATHPSEGTEVLCGGWLSLFAATISASLHLSNNSRKNNNSNNKKSCYVKITSLENWVTPLSRVMTQYYYYHCHPVKSVTQWSLLRDSCVTGRVAAAVSSYCLHVSKTCRNTLEAVSFLRQFCDIMSLECLQLVSRHKKMQEDDTLVSSVSQVAMSCVLGHMLRYFLQHTQQVSSVSLKPLLTLYATQMKHTAVSLGAQCSGVASVSCHANTVVRSLLVTLSSDLRDTQDTLVRCTVSPTTSNITFSLDKVNHDKSQEKHHIDSTNSNNNNSNHMDGNDNNSDSEGDDSMVTDEDSAEDNDSGSGEEDLYDSEEDEDDVHFSETDNNNAMMDIEEELDNDDNNNDNDKKKAYQDSRVSRTDQHTSDVVTDTDNSGHRVLQAMWASVLPPLCLTLTSASCMCLRHGSVSGSVSQVWYDVSQLLYAYGSVWVKQQGGVATHVPSATALVSRCLNLLVQHLPHLFVVTTSSITSGRQVAQVVSRLCALLPAIKALQKHLPPLFAHLILALAHPTVVTTTNNTNIINNNDNDTSNLKAMTEALQPGLLALYEALTSRDRRTVFAQLDPTARSVMNELNDEYQRNYRFVGN